MYDKNRHCPTFSIGEARHIVRDLFEPNPVIYWADFLGSMAVGSACFFALPRVNSWTLAALAYCGAVVAYYRAVLFTHELTHLKRGSFRWFRVAWNALCGIPFLIPSVLYETHVAHHARRHYGTRNDGEYLPFARRPLWYTLGYLGQPLVQPLISIVRFGFLTPLTWVNRSLRDVIFRRASSMVIDPRYVRPLPTATQMREWRIQEVGCFLMIWGVVAGVALGLIPWHFIARAYAIAAAILMLNALRTLGAHRFRNEDGEMTFTEQLLDSLNYPYWSWATELWAPVGLRFHALHHLFPSMPYHNLATAHRRLMAQLPADSIYRETNISGPWQAWRELRADIRESTRRDRPDDGPASPTRLRGTRASSERLSVRS